MTGWMREMREHQQEADAEERADRDRDRYAAAADALPDGEWLTIPQAARLWWPERYPGGCSVAARKRRYSADASAAYRIRRMVAAGLVETDQRPHPERDQLAVYIRRTS